MTTRLCLAAAGLVTTSHKGSKEVQVGRATGISRGSSSWPLLVLGRAIRNVATGCSAKCVEDREEVRAEDLRLGGVYKGRISVVESYGVFVDIGTDVDGFVHVSRLSRPLVSRRMEIGQDVTVQIVDLDHGANAISLLLAEEGFTVTLNLQPLALSEREILNRTAARRAIKFARHAETRPVMSLETRQRLKAHRRVVLAEQQAIRLHQLRSRTSLFETPAADDRE